MHEQVAPTPTHLAPEVSFSLPLVNLEQLVRVLLFKQLRSTHTHAQVTPLPKNMHVSFMHSNSLYACSFYNAAHHTRKQARFVEKEIRVANKI